MSEEFVHLWRPGARPDLTLLLLHGTGGDEHDLLPLAKLLAPEASVLSPRGQVLEHGMPRYFRRLSEGVFDVPDLHRRTAELAGFLDAAAARYAFVSRGLVAAGFSNGANIAASLLLSRPDALAGAILVRPMVPFVPEAPPPIGGRPVLVAAGRTDAIARPEQAETLAGLLRDAGAEVTLHWSPGGHGIEPPDVRAAREWLERHFPG